MISGCDIITPIDFNNKPKCRFCGIDGTNWEHLIFKCSKFDSQLIARIYRTKFETDSIKDDILQLLHLNDYTTLLDKLLCLDSKMHYKSHINLLMNLMANVISRIIRMWKTAAPSEDDEV